MNDIADLKEGIEQEIKGIKRDIGKCFLMVLLKNLNFVLM